MGRTLWFNPVFGVSGDMVLGALLDVGGDEPQVRSDLAALDVDGWELVVETVSRRGLQSRHAHVTAAEDTHRSWSSIDRHLEVAPIRAQVRSGARATFRALAEVEASRHGVDLDEVEFHEVGAVDAIVDIVGSWAALTSLRVDNVWSGPVGLGAGSVTAAHGEIPHPAPAVLGLLEGLPITSVDSDLETATPTGSALLKTMVDKWGSVPSGRLLRSGFGAGGRDPESHANLLAAIIIETEPANAVKAVVLETNVDDVTPEIIAFVVERVLAAGADDAWTVPVVMKKGRPGREIHVLCSAGLAPELAELLAKETGTLGIRSNAVTKQVYPRTFYTVMVDGHEIAIKSGPYGAKPEFEDVKSAALDTDRSAIEISREALTIWRSRVLS
jgi:pyridinium-3,5-bisthiocarboxylic acid mononucleotide nickel chelatase